MGGVHDEAVGHTAVESGDGVDRAATPPAKTPLHLLPRAKQAGIRCKELAFQLWLSAKYPAHSDVADDAAEAVRRICRSRIDMPLASRCELDTNTIAGACWDKLETQYEQDTGRMAEDR